MELNECWATHHITKCMRFKKFAFYIFIRMANFFHPYFCPFLLLEYNKEAGKNIAYT